MDLPVNPSAMIELLRAWFHAKDRSVVLPSDTFVQSPEITTPGNPPTNNRKIYPKTDGWYDLQDDGTETRISADGGTLVHDHSTTAEGGSTVNLAAGNSYQIDSSPLISAIAMFQQIPGLVGFWPMSGVQRSTGDARDFGGGGLELSYNGNPVYNIFDDLVPYIDFDGTGDFLERADETDLDILGTETIYASAVRGLTVGGWIRADVLSGNQWLIAKDNASASHRPYTLILRAGNPNSPTFRVGSGAATSTLDSSVDVTVGAWFFAVGRFIPSTSVDVYVNNTKTTNTTSIIASIANTADSLTFGATEAGSLPFNGQESFCFLSANALSDTLISALFQQSRGLFGI